MNADDLADRMAANLETMREAAGYGPLPSMGSADRKMLFGALAKAIVEHIQQKAVVNGTVDTSQASTRQKIDNGTIT